MSPSPIEYLRHIRDEVVYLSESTSGFTKEQLLNDATLKRAVVRSLEIIGEATRNLPMTFRNQHSAVDWKNMAGMRDRLIHGYMSVDYDVVWNVIRDDLPILRLQIEQIINQQNL
jgi:uncharacterized protein with HEPN domain